MLLIEYFLFKYEQTMEYFIENLELTNNHFKLIRDFCVILIGNCILICIAWKIYGSRITRTFGNPNNVEKLRTSHLEFQLPAEHQFSFK